MSEQDASLLQNATRDLARFGAGLRYDQLNDAVISKIKASVLDSIGCCLFGATLPWTRKIAEMAEAEGARPVASLIGMGRKTSIALAALVNSTAGHAFELDDIHKESIVHPGSLAIPVALAFAESRSAVDGRQFITALVAGYEIGTRVGNAATMELFFRGFHPQGTSGAFVAAATAAHMLKLDEGAFTHTLGIVGSQAGGLMASQEGAMVKRFHSGRAAQSGVYSALLAANGFTGITNVLEASYGGYLSSYSGKPNAKRLTDGLGSTWETLQVGYKPHASVTSIHAAQDSLRAIMLENALTADNIAVVRAGVSTMTYVHCAWAYKTQGVTAAQMNLYYGLAIIALDGRAFTEQFRESRLADPRVVAFIERINAYVDPDIEAMGASFRHAARVCVTTYDGRTIEKLTLNRRGSPENPLSPDEIVAKFRAVVAPCLDPRAADRIVTLVDRLESLDSVSELVDIVAAPVTLPQ